MISIVSQNFSLNRIVLLLVGLWPYQNSKLVQLQIILCLGTLISSVVYQFAVFISADCTINLIFKVFSIALFFSMYVIEYNSFRINRQAMKWSLEQLQCICNELRDEIEINIMRKCGDHAKRYAILFISFQIFNLLSIVLYPLALYILDIVLCINEYHLNHVIQMFIPKHFVGRKNYFYLIFLHSGATICIGGTVIIATLMMCITYSKHACGMFKIASYRIEKAVNTPKIDHLKNEITMYREIIEAVDIHRKAIKSTAIFFSSFLQSRFVLIIFAVITLSLNLYGISETITIGHDFQDVMFHVLIVADIFLYMFILNYAGQEFTDCNDHIFLTSYNVRWYVAPLHVQKLILFLLQRGNKTVSLHFGMMFVLSLELFATLTKASISYFTLMCSIQQ
ncbi:PREDICTED: odorant receptor 63a-like [Wasmannia auropunctata]|uniref:odorant receptor 63a-like n=1 Tax=Wasmannia auropunctata TaxID=64793 RepID=UPI0005EE21AE|nr:PREDICTED: odorant receptor 63a-like [Wasmannia auropunctata]